MQIHFSSVAQAQAIQPQVQKGIKESIAKEMPAPDVERALQDGMARAMMLRASGRYGAIPVEVKNTVTTTQPFQFDYSKPMLIQQNSNTPKLVYFA